MEKRGVTGGAIIDIDIPHKLNVPYNDNKLEDEIDNALKDCYSKEADGISKYTAIEKVLNIKGWEKAVADKKLVILLWNENEGYQIMPMKKEPKPKRGYTAIEEQIIKLEKHFVPGELAKAVRVAIKISTI